MVDEHEHQQDPGTPQDAAPGEQPAEDVPAEDVRADDAPAEDLPVEDEPAEDVPAEDVPAEDLPVVDEPRAEGESEVEAAPVARAATRRRGRRAASRPAGPPIHVEEPPAGGAGENAGSGEDQGPQDAPEGQQHGDGATEPGAETVPAVAHEGLTPSTEETPAEPDPAASTRRPRRATRPVTTVAFSSVPFAVKADEPRPLPSTAGDIPVVALFQPPDEARAVRRRRRVVTEEPLPVEDVDVPEAPDVDEEADEDDDMAPRRRRRRGGRRRRRAGAPLGEGGFEGEEADVEGSEDAGEADVDGAEPGTDEEAEDRGSVAPADETPSARRRRRRRRRAGVAEEMEDLSSDDPPNTVVKVRESRHVTDEITSVRGSTRIEAKKQRRRDGRDAGRRRAPILTEAEFLARRESVNRVMCVRERGDRTQIAVLEDGVLVEHYVNRAESSSMVGNVYLGKVQNVLPSMEAAFVDIGRGRNAVLYAGEVNWDAAGLEGQPKRIELALKSGDAVLVQVTKDPIGHKGARLTSQISLPGRFLVYVPEGSMTGISRKLPDTERARLKGILKDVVPDGAGVIVRTAAEGATEEQLTADVHRLTAQWADITKKAKSASAPALLYGEPDLAIKVVRDIFNEDFTTLLVEGQSTWQTLTDYIGWVAPDLLPKLALWTEPTDLYVAHRIDEQLAKALDRKVWLPSGGSLVIDRTEAMTVIDVNTGRFTGQGGNLEETVTRNNLEAAEEIVRQLRLRDIGGIIVVDFIDMVLESNRDLVLRRLVECLGRDRTKHQVAEVTSLGLVQMTRKRIGQGLLEVFSVPCEHCGGRGHTVHTEPAGNGSHDDRRGGEPRNARRSAGGRGLPANLGGKQTGRTPPPPRFDEHGHPVHVDHEHADHEHADHEHVDHEHADHEHAGNGSAHVPEEPQDLPLAVVHEGRGDHEGPVVGSEDAV